MGTVSKFTPARSPQSSDMAESLVKTFKRGYVFCNDRPYAETAREQLSGWFEDYNENAHIRPCGCSHLVSLSVHYKT